MQLSDDDLARAVQLVAAIRSPHSEDEGGAQKLEELHLLLKFPALLNLIFMTDFDDEGVVNEALKHRPIAL